MTVYNSAEVAVEPREGATTLNVAHVPQVHRFMISLHQLKMWTGSFKIELIMEFWIVADIRVHLAFFV